MDPRPRVHEGKLFAGVTKTRQRLSFGSGNPPLLKFVSANFDGGPAQAAVGIDLGGNSLARVGRCDPTLPWLIEGTDRPALKAPG